VAPFLTVSEAARRLGVRPRDISDLFYQRRLSDELCPVASGRRLIPLEYLPVIAAALLDRQRKGSLAAPGPGVRPGKGRPAAAKPPRTSGSGERRARRNGRDTDAAGA
jgi:hypothetical protein